MTASFNCFKHSGILATPIRCCIKWVPLTGCVSVFAFAPRPQLTDISFASSPHTLASCFIPAKLCEERRGRINLASIYLALR